MNRGLHDIAGLPKATMEAAVARGQGKSTTGLALESLTIEAIMPQQIALVIDAETDNKNRTMMELRTLVKSYGGNCTPTSYLFQRKGVLRFEKDERNLGVDEVLDEAIEAGAEDVEADDEGNIIVWTEPNKITSAAQSLQTSLGLKVDSSDIIWDANEETKVSIETPAVVKALAEFVSAAQENPNVLGIYANASQGTIEDEVWEDLEGRLAA
jgi:transcriptional/translational regulatory protein YebC/TACO1